MKILCELDNIFFSFILPTWGKKQKQKQRKTETSLFFPEKIEKPNLLKKYDTAVTEFQMVC